jgi:hypothetical protein
MIGKSPEFFSSKVKPNLRHRLLSLLRTVAQRLSTPDQHPSWLKISPSAIPRIILSIEHWPSVRYTTTTKAVLSRLRHNKFEDNKASLSTVPGASKMYWEDQRRQRESRNGGLKPMPTSYSVGSDDYEVFEETEETRKLPEEVHFEYYNFERTDLKILYPPPKLRWRHPELKPLLDDNDYLVATYDINLGRKRRKRVSAANLRDASTCI